MGRMHFLSISCSFLIMLLYLSVGECMVNQTDFGNLENGEIPQMPDFGNSENGMLNMSGFENPNFEMPTITSQEEMDEFSKICEDKSTQINMIKQMVELMENESMKEHLIANAEKGYDLLCDYVHKFKMSDLTTDQIVPWIFSAKGEPTAIYKLVRSLNKASVIDVLKKANAEHWTEHPDLSAVVAALGEQLVKSAGGSRRLTVTDMKTIGNSAIFMIPTNAIKSLSDSVFEYFIRQMANTSKIVIELAQTELTEGCQFEECQENEQHDGVSPPTDDQQSSIPTYEQQFNVSSHEQPSNFDSAEEKHSQEQHQQMGPDLRLVPMFFVAQKRQARLKAICQRLFQKYHSPARLNSKTGWNMVKYSLFCAPAKVCQNIKPDLIKEDIETLKFLPWSCGRVPELEMEESQVEGQLSYGEVMQAMRHLFPSNTPCGMALLSKVVSGKNPLYPITSVDSLKRLSYFSTCVPDKALKSAIDSIGCVLGLEMIKFGAFGKWVSNYAARKCMSVPENLDNVTCDGIKDEYSPFLSTMKMQFFKKLNQSILCEHECMNQFKAHDVSSNVMNFLMDKCYGKDIAMTADVVSNLGALVTDLPVEKFDQISTADLESNLDSIKKDLKESKRKRRKAKKRAVMGKLAKKLIGDGKLSAIVDSKEIMKQVSLKELKSSLSSSSDLLTDLGIKNASSDVAMTDSQKKWVVKELLKKKSAMTLEDITGMSGLVTGLLSKDIKQIGESGTNDSALMEFTKVMCSYNNWPTKSLKAINTNLIQKALTLRNSENPMSSLTMVDVESIGCECFMHLRAADYGAMEDDICSGVCQKVGYCSNFRCLNQRSRKNTLQACLKCKGLGSNPMSNTDIEELGPSLIAQMTKKQLDLVPSTVLAGHVQFLKEMCMNNMLREAVTDALPRVIGSKGSEYSSEILYLLGSAIKLLPSSILEELDMSVLAEMSDTILDEMIPKDEDAIKLKKCCEQWLPPEDLNDLSKLNLNLMLTLKTAIFTRAETESSRRRRSTSEWTCSFIREFPSLFTYATEPEVTAMDNAEFVECLTDIGQLDDFNEENLKDVLLAKAKTALGEDNVCNMDVADITSLGSILTSLTTDDINCLPLNDVSLMTAIGSTEGWSSSQLTAIATRYMSSNSLTDLSGLTDSDIGLLGPILCGFSANHIKTIPSLEIGESGTVIGALQCDVAILTELAKLASMADAFGPVSEWGAAEVAELNYLIAGLSGTDIVQLTVGALEGLNPAVIPEIPAAVFKELSITQLESFTDAQATAVSATQLAELSEEKNALLNKQSTGGVEEIPELQMTDDANKLFSTFHIVISVFNVILVTKTM